MPPALQPRMHYLRTARMLVETLGGLVLLCALGIHCARLFEQGQSPWALSVAAVALQGLWFHRLYTAAHEAVHRKLIPHSPLLNDVVGQLLLLTILVPIDVYRQIHRFHHGHNRRDHATATLDGYLSDGPPSALRRAWFSLLWYGGVFFGGYFLHGVISILLFLFVPPRLAPRISPAFQRWQLRDQLQAISIFAAAIGGHLAFAWVFGGLAWQIALLYPFLVFAWVYSSMVYIFHYRTSYGDEVRFNVRSVPAGPLYRWWLLNFNHHRVHHRHPGIPWHQLPDEPAPLPEPYAANENVGSLLAAIAQQRQGPSIFPPAGLG